MIYYIYLYTNRESVCVRERIYRYIRWGVVDVVRYIIYNIYIRRSIGVTRVIRGLSHGDQRVIRGLLGFLTFIYVHTGVFQI